MALKNTDANVNILTALTDALTGAKTHTAEVVRYGEKLIVPEGMPIDGAIDVLTKRRDAEEADTGIHQVFRCYPYEGAMALETALKDVLGYVDEQGTPSFFGSRPPLRVDVEIGYGESKKVLWGRVQIAADGGYLSPDTSTDAYGNMTFLLTGIFKKKHQYKVDKIVAKMREILSGTPFYASKALTMRFTNDDGELLPMPEIQFYNFHTSEVDALTFSRSLEQLIGSNVSAPILHRAACRAANVPFKRGILLAGKYGTGKTLLARKVARDATENGVTFIYIKNVRDLPNAINFARNYQPAVIFGEDIDRVVGTQTRTEELDTILNTLDGIDSKNTDVMVVLTTNHLENINKAMLRPGRIDVLIEVLPPDAEAAIRLIHVYGRELIAKEDLTAAGKKLAGMIPAVIREVVERAKLVSIWRTSQAPTVGSITGEDILGAIDAMAGQLNVLNEVKVVELTVQEKAAAIMASGYVEAARVTAEAYTDVTE